MASAIICSDVALTPYRPNRSRAALTTRVCAALRGADRNRATSAGSTALTPERVPGLLAFPSRSASLLLADRLEQRGRRRTVVRPDERLPVERTARRVLGDTQARSPP